MDPATAMIAVGAAIFGGAVLRWLVRKPGDDGGRSTDPRGRPQPERRNGPSTDRDPPVLRVVALGLEGAGKTVLLASQFHTLSTPDSERRFFLDADWEQENYLAGLFTTVSDPLAPWPRATRIGLHELVFGCTAHDLADVERTLFQISYLDYAGELLASEPLDESRDPLHPVTGEQGALKELKASVRAADALLLILDGRRMLQLLRAEAAGKDYFEWRMAPLLAVARRAKCPVQLILTKWDLVRTFDDSADEKLLHKVRDELLSNRRVELIVQAQRSRNQRVRLIPVSAVGPGFADLNAEGEVVKRPDGRVQPVHVDVPLCAVLPDVLRQLERDHAEWVRMEIERAMRRRKSANAAAIVRSVLESPAGRVLQTAASGFVGRPVVKLFVELLVTEAKAVPGQRQPRDADDEELQQLRAAVVNDMRAITARVERAYPSSILR